MTIIPEGKRGTSKAARERFKSLEGVEKLSNTQYDASKIIQGMDKEGVEITSDLEKEVFSNVAKGNGAIYSKYRK